jgi:hypothetical protein
MILLIVMFFLFRILTSNVHFLCVKNASNIQVFAWTIKIIRKKWIYQQKQLYMLGNIGMPLRFKLIYVLVNIWPLFHLILFKHSALVLISWQYVVSFIIMILKGNSVFYLQKNCVMNRVNYNIMIVMQKHNKAHVWIHFKLKDVTAH